MRLERKIFKRGATYRPKRDFVSGNSTFIAGESIVFDRDGYSHYDDCFVYEFHGAKGEPKVWIMPIDQPEGSWVDFFAEASP